MASNRYANYNYRWMFCEILIKLCLITHLQSLSRKLYAWRINEVNKSGKRKIKKL